MPSGNVDAQRSSCHRNLPDRAVVRDRRSGATLCWGEVASSERRCLTPGAGQPFKDCERCPEMVLVPSGRFVMGAPSSEERHPGTSEREDQVQVTIAKPFAVGRFSVTRGEFAAFIAESGHSMDGACFDGCRWRTAQSGIGGRLASRRTTGIQLCAFPGKMRSVMSTGSSPSQATHIGCCPKRNASMLRGLDQRHHSGGVRAFR